MKLLKKINNINPWDGIIYQKKEDKSIKQTLLSTVCLQKGAEYKLWFYESEGGRILTWKYNTAVR